MHFIYIFMKKKAAKELQEMRPKNNKFRLKAMTVDYLYSFT